MQPPVIGYVIRMFPQASETFIANEVLELERLGVSIHIYSYRRPQAIVPHAILQSIHAPITYLPDPLYRHPLRLQHAHRMLHRLDPHRYRQTVAYVLAECFKYRNIDTWRRFLQAGSLACLAMQSKVQHLHAHFAHGATRVGMLASMLTGIPFSFTAHARDIFSHDVNFAQLGEKVERAQFVITVSCYNREFLRSHIGPVADTRVHTVYNGVDLCKFCSDPAVKRANSLILGVGRLVDKKGFSYLLQACHILHTQGRAFTCEIIGDGELRAHLLAEVCQLGLQQVVSLVGPRSQEELPGYYRRATVVAMPAVVSQDGNRDALPTVLLEAMACGAPVVASRLTGIPEIVDHEENGLLVEPGDPAALARAIELLLVNPALRDRYGVTGRAKVERCFDLGKNVQELYQLFGRYGQEPIAVGNDEVRLPVL